MQLPDSDITALAEFLRRHPRLVVLTGAGISAASGIPPYRDETGRWLHSAPIMHRDFLDSEATRRRYWARSWHGWPVVRDAVPNTAHRALAALEQRQRIELLVTQNVDRLHQRAGSERVVDLHGRLDRVRCLSCELAVEREAIQERLLPDRAPDDTPRTANRPDGDMDIDTDLARKVVLPRCDRCAGDLMPDVVFFGGNIPRRRVDTCATAIARADALLVVGSSLRVFSGFRLCRSAHRAGKPIAIVNRGMTRADGLAALTLHCAAAPLLERVVASLR